jgi:hypothetical protein
MLDMIIDKMQFITYNTLRGFQSNITLTVTNLDNGNVRQINHDECKNNFILGRKSFENNDVSGFDDDTFGELSDNVLYISNTIYEYKDKKYNKCEIINYDDLEDDSPTYEPENRYTTIAFFTRYELERVEITIYNAVTGKEMDSYFINYEELDLKELFEIKEVLKSR